jgi:hypothetical protein
MLHKLVFSTEDASSIADSHNVGAFVRAGKGGAIVTYHADEQANSATSAFTDTDVTAGSDSITLTAHGFNNGDKVRFTTDGTLPDPLAVLTDYWVIYVDANTIKVAASQEDAELGIAIDLTDGGSGNHSMNGQSYSIRALDVHVTNPVEIFATDLDIRDLDAAQDSIAAWTNDGAGNPISSTGTALDVNIASSDINIDVEIDGVYDVGTNPDPDNVGVIAHVRGAAPADADQTFRSTGGAADSDAVVAANVHGLDVNSFLMGYNGTTWDRLNSTSGDLNINDGGNSITVDATDLDIRDLTHVSDSIRLGDGTDLFTSTTIGSDIGLDVNVINDPSLANTDALANAKALTAGNTAEDLLASQLTNRKYLWIYNNDNREMYIGLSGDSTTSASGFPIPPGSYLPMRAGAALSFEFVSSKTGHDARLLQLS